MSPRCHSGPYFPVSHLTAPCSCCSSCSHGTRCTPFHQHSVPSVIVFYATHFAKLTFFKLYGDKSGIKSTKHTLQSILPDLEGAAGALEDEIQQLHDDEERLISSIAQTVDSLASLRYGDFSNPRINELVAEELVALQEECAKKSKS